MEIRVKFKDKDISSDGTGIEYIDVKNVLSTVHGILAFERGGMVVIVPHGNISYLRMTRETWDAT